jgi:hypothetical protein
LVQLLPLQLPDLLRALPLDLSSHRHHGRISAPKGTIEDKKKYCDTVLLSMWLRKIGYKYTGTVYNCQMSNMSYSKTNAPCFNYVKILISVRRATL